MIESYEVAVFIHSLRNIFLTKKALYSVTVEAMTRDPLSSKSKAFTSYCPPYVLFKSKYNKDIGCVDQPLGFASLTHSAYLSQQMEIKYIGRCCLIEISKSSSMMWRSSKLIF